MLVLYLKITLRSQYVNARTSAFDLTTTSDIPRPIEALLSCFPAVPLPGIGTPGTTTEVDWAIKCLFISQPIKSPFPVVLI